MVNVSGHRNKASASARVAAIAALTTAALAATSAPSANALGLTVSASPVAALEQSSFSGTAATFSGDSPLFCSAGEYSATVTWADVSGSQPATVAPSNTGTCTFAVTAARAFGEETSGGGIPYTVHVAGPLLDQGSADGAAVVRDADLRGAADAGAAVIQEGEPLGGEIAVFLDANASAPLSDFNAAIDWGDGSPATGGTVAAAPATGAGAFSVSGTHAFTSPGTFTASLAVTDVGGSSVTVRRRVDAGDAPLSAAPATIAATAGSQFTSAVATFSDAFAGAGVGDYVTAIDWGDGSKPTTGTVAAQPSRPGSFTVGGSHAYTRAGSYAVSVLVADADGASQAATTSAAHVGPAAGGGSSLPVPSSLVSLTSSANANAAPVSISRPRFGARRSIVVVLRCPAGGDCRGVLRLITVPDPHARNPARRRAVPLGASLFILPAGSSEKLDIRLPRAAGRLLAASTVRVRALATGFSPSGPVASSSAVGTLRMHVGR